MGEIKIRWAHREDWAPAMTMIWKTFMKFDAKDYTKEGVKNFFDFITDDRIYQSFLLVLYFLRLPNSYISIKNSLRLY